MVASDRLKKYIYITKTRLSHIFSLNNNPSLDDDERTSSFILRSSTLYGAKTDRRIYINLPLPDSRLDKHGYPKEKFNNNKIVTTKYTPLSFLPKNLYEQFRRVANLFFLVMAILQCLPWFNSGHLEFILFPLATVLFFTASKDAFEDHKRYQADGVFNSSSARKLYNWVNFNYIEPKKRLRWYHKLLPFSAGTRGPASEPSQVSLVQEGSGLFSPKFDTILWQDIRVGDIIYIAKDESVPADVLLLSTSSSDGDCFIETKNLDGETNLKSREALKETSHLQEPEDCARLQGHVDTTPPSTNLYFTNGSISIVDNFSTYKKHSFAGSIDSDLPLSNISSNPIPFTIKNVLLRGCILKNTDYAIGIVIYTGVDTKIMLNSNPPPSKRSRIEKRMNRQVAFNFAILFALATIIAIAYGIVCQKYRLTRVARLFGIDNNSGLFNAFYNFWLALILLQNIIPVSLYVSIETVKCWQAYTIFNDIRMYFEPSNSGCIAKSWTLSDDLGQISYIFSDKTGTLTRNIMEFKKCSINGKIYGDVPIENLQFEGHHLGSNHSTSPQSGSLTLKDSQILDFFDTMKSVYNPKYANMDPETVAFYDSTFFNDILKNGSEAVAIKEFFLNLALCHSALLESNLSGFSLSESSFVELDYRAESPDEKALVAAARDLGFVFLGKSKNIFKVEALGQIYEFELLANIEFDSTRKRMSVIFRRPAPWNDIILLSKGADNVILDRLAPNQDDLLNTTMAHLKEFSNSGLRTLCLAYRYIGIDEFREWNDRYRAAQSDTINREYQLSTVYDQMERDLILMGSTAIEDKLQEQVPECISSLREAGIKIWVLTGDKMETAINIGFSSSLLTKEMKIWTVSGGNSRAVIENFNHIVNEMDLAGDDEQHALVVDGSALKRILEKRGVARKLLELAPKFSSVLCCRTSPLQKAQVVRLIKKGLRKLTLSIGDGANDVSMIQEAHVGVAIAGEEGLQASMASDYSISQFRFLANLLLVHGQFSYHRISEMILCFFYKNAIFTFVGFWYQFFCGFSSNLFFTLVLISIYNLIFTFAPVILLGATDQRLTYDYLLQYPQIYRLGIQGKFFNNKLYFYYIFDSVWQSVVIFVGFYFLYNENIVSYNGKGSSAYELSSGIAILIILLSNIFTGFHTRAWNWIVHLGIYVSVFLVFIFLIIYSVWDVQEFYFTAIDLFKYSFSFWLNIPLIIVTGLLPRVMYFYIKITFFPDDLDLVREIKHLNKVKARSLSLSTE